MTTKDDLDERLARLRAEWPVGSMVDDVMARIAPAAVRRVRRVGRLFAGLAASGLIAALVLSWVIVASRPATLLAAVQEGLERARSAHLVITSWDDRDAAHREEIWYRREQGLRAEMSERVVLEDGKFQWSWRTGAGGDESVVLRQRSPGFFTTQLKMLGLSGVLGDWARVRAPELDRELNGRACRGFTVSPPEGDRDVSRGPGRNDQAAFRGLVLAEADGRIHEITVQQRRDDGTWRRVREIRLEYDVPIPAEKVEARLPAGARVVDVDEAFHNRYPIDRAIHKVEVGGLILAVHDIQPLLDCGGFYVVSSVRGTPGFLEAYPPRPRPVNPELVVLDVAFQPMTNRVEGTRYNRIVLGSVTREGVEFCWWLIVPRRLFQVRNGIHFDLPAPDQPAAPGEPARLDDVPGTARVPLSATYWDEKHRDADGAQQGVSTWAEVPVPPNRPPTTLDDVAGRARRDLVLMNAGAAGGVFGVAADGRRDGQTLRSPSRFAPEAISDADFAAAVRRGLDDLDEVPPRAPGEDLLPPALPAPPAGGGRAER